MEDHIIWAMLTTYKRDRISFSEGLNDNPILVCHERHHMHTLHALHRVIWVYTIWMLSGWRG